MLSFQIIAWLQNEKCFLTCIYHSPSQNQDEFRNLCTNFDILLNNINDELPLCLIVKGDFNACGSRWWKNDITNLQGQELDSLTLSARYNQIIDQPKHVINNSRSCIDLIFCTNQSVISNHGVDVSIFDKVIIMLFMVKLTYVYLSLQHMCESLGL